MQKYRYYILIIFAFTIMACDGDKGNYDYHSIAEPKISGIDQDISMLTYDQLQINPVVDNDGIASDSLSYEWSVIPKQGDDAQRQVLATSKDIDIRIELAEGTYALYFKVTDRTSSTYVQHISTLTVSDALTCGWMVLCSDNGRSRLDMVSDVTGRTYYDVLANKGMPVMNGPRRIQWLSSKTDENSPYYLLTDDGATRLGKEGFNWKKEYLMRYESAEGEDLTPYSIAVGGFGKVIVSGSSAHYAEVSGIDGLYGSKVNKDFAVASGVGVNVDAMMYAAVYLLYDIDHGRFMAYCPLLRANDLGALDPLMTMPEMEDLAKSMNRNKEAVTGSAFDEYPEGLKYVYMENTKYDPGNGKMGRTYTILSDGKYYYLYGIQMGDILLFADCTSVIGRSYYKPLSMCENIMNASHFAFSSLKNHAYYSVGGTVYKIDLSKKYITSTPVLTFENENVTCLKFNLYSKDENSSRCYDLIVGTEDSAGIGTLHIYEGLNSDGDYASVKPTEYSGFSRIVDVTYKE